MRGYMLFMVLVGAASAAPKDPKSLLSVFQIVKFDNGDCQTTSAKMGTCYTQAECTAAGGTADGTCASAYGVCCLFSVTTSGFSTKYNNTYFSNPTAMINSNTLEICPLSTNISQVRLDFTSFNIAGPDTDAALAVPAVAANGAGGSVMTLSDSSLGWTSHPNTHGQCNTDYMTVTTTGAKAIPRICGTNAGQHMYVEMDGTTCITLTIFLGTPATQTWDIQVAQIERMAEWEAPSGCLQYFTGTTGSFKSFNYANSIHLADQDYSVCFRKEDTYCSISYTATKFQVSAVDYPNNFGSGFGKCNSVDLLPTDLTVAQDNLQLGNDWLYIPMASDPAGSGTYDRFCGLWLHGNNAAQANANMTSSQNPFRVGVLFDSTERAGTFGELASSTSSAGDADRGDMGFDIAFAQNAC